LLVIEIKFWGQGPTKNSGKSISQPYKNIATNCLGLNLKENRGPGKIHTSTMTLSDSFALMEKVIFQFIVKITSPLCLLK